MTSVSPGARLVAVREWEPRGSKDKGTITWRQEKMMDASRGHYSQDYKMCQVAATIQTLVHLATSSVQLILAHLCPFATVDVKYPHVSQYLAFFVYSSRY